MSTKLTILFYGKTAKTTSNGLVPIYLRVTIDGKRFEISTARYVEPAKWSSEAGRVKGNSEEARSINYYIDSLREKVYTYQQELIREKQDITVETLRRKWIGVTERQKTIVEVFQYHNNQMEQLLGKDFAAGTLERYKTSLQHTIDFMKWKYRVSDMAINEFTYSFITDYEFWLKTVRNCNQNSTTKYLGNFRKIVNICLKNGWIDKDPFYGYKMTKVEVERDFLSEKELEKIRNKVFATDRLNQVKDIFVFSCYTGLAYADVKKLKRTEITFGIDGERWIYTAREKTGTPSRIPILPPAAEILERYNNHPQCVNQSKVLPVPSNQKVNAYLKEIGDICEITKNLTFHIARHTFATTVTLSNGVPIESVSKMLGHRNLTMTQHYAKVVDRKISDDMQALKSKLNPISISNNRKAV